MARLQRKQAMPPIERLQMARGLSFGSRAAKASSPGCRRVAESQQTMFISMPRQGISDAAVKHLSRF